MSTEIKKSATKRTKASIQKNASASKNDNPFLEMIVEGLESLDQNHWEHYLREDLNFDFEPKNLFTKAPYRRLNRLTLMLDMMMNNFATPYYATFNSISKAGGKIKKGSKSRIVQYFDFDIKHKITGNRISVSVYNTLSIAMQSEYLKKSFLKNYRVFNCSWIENLEDLKIEIVTFDEELENLEEIETNTEAEIFIKNLIDNKGLKLIEGKNNTAFYTPSLDTITMPPLKWFKDDVKYYSTLFHEAIHWTGHTTRLNRFEGNSGKENYAHEELIAEMGAMLVYFDFNYKIEFINSLVYLKGWLKQTDKSKDKIKTLEEAFKDSIKAVNFLQY